MRDYKHFFCHYSDHFGYVTTLKHAAGQGTTAKGVHVTWMLASFLKFSNLVSYPQGISPPRVVLKDDSVTLKVLPNLFNCIRKLSLLVKILILGFTLT